MISDSLMRNLMGGLYPADAAEELAEDVIAGIDSPFDCYFIRSSDKRAATLLLTNGFMPYIEDAIEETGLP